MDTSEATQRIAGFDAATTLVGRRLQQAKDSGLARLFPYAPVELTVFGFAQEYGLVVVLALAKGHVAAAVHALEAGILEFILGYPRGKVRSGQNGRGHRCWCRRACLPLQ